ncbi:DNA-directed RNA polymerase subunit alpha C-terminal domain-containing protein [Clostridium baratii]|uniref:DNA-directed RNA polymerase subunit alpha C-terminal domain-containing protein n=1 Tax=Clostridium baratii TaxID=1561 RepID=UPI0005F2EE76|nr:DNA-directed RNA polymerase subunit alpha C-terminal domain-containing protein [Clostridium baratii]AQM58527.1 hypothetical protein NPD11_3116 [Clostridium baratii]KJU72381.1 hypothetical protein UC77_04415 [Clostridium baratii]
MDKELRECFRLMNKLRRYYKHSRFKEAEELKSNIKNKLLKQVEVLDNLDAIRRECNIDEDADISLANVNLSKSLKNSLFRNGYKTINDLYNEDLEILRDLKMVGQMRLDEIQRFKDWVKGKNKAFYIKNI